MNNYRRERDFDFRIGLGVIVSGTVSGELLPAERDVGPEVRGLKVDARVYEHILDGVGIPLEEFKATKQTHEDIEQYAMDVLCREEDMSA